MDYEKKYKEMKARVLEIGRGYVNGVDFSKPRQIAEYIDPDLKESEDERIRKGLIEHLKELKEQSVEGSHLKRPEYYDAWIAWLEKKDEKKLLNNEEYQTVPVETLDRLYAAEKELERLKQSEQEPINQCNTHESTIDEARKWNEAYERGYSLGYENGRHEQKQVEWSEEDEEMFDSVIADIQFTQKAHNHEVNQVVYEREIDWFKSIKDRVQPKQEWSEQDKMHLKNAILAVEKEWGVDSFTAKWLKSFQPKHITYELDAPLSYDKDMNPIYPPINHWKPSEKQMKELARITRGNSYPYLSSLYNELKKL